MSDAPERIWAVTEPDDISADILGDVYAQQVPDGMVGKPVEYVRADIVDALVAEKVREALTEAAHLMPRFFGVCSSTGVPIGVWDDGQTAASVLGEYPAGQMLDLIDASAILALRDQKEPKG